MDLRMKQIGLSLAGLIAAVFLIYVADRHTHIANAHAAKQSGPALASNAADSKLQDLNGRDTSLRQFQGKVVLVNFWATWCGPCRIEIPWLMEFQDKYGAQGLVVLGVAMDDGGKRAVAPFVEKERFQLRAGRERMNYPVVIGNDQYASAFGGLLGLPSTVVISREGKPVQRVDGLLNHDAMEKVIQSLLELK